MPLELVQKVTGHKTVDIVLKQYFQLGQEDFRQALNAAMPKVLTAGKDHTTRDHGTTDHGPLATGPARSRVAQEKTAREELRDLIDEVKPKALRERMLKLLERV